VLVFSDVLGESERRRWAYIVAADKKQVAVRTERAFAG